MIIKWLFADLFGRLCSWICAIVFSLLHCASALYAPQSLSARAQFADPVRIPLRPCLPCSWLASRCFTGHRSVHVAPPCAYPSSYIRIPSSSCYRASFLTDNTSGISCHVRRFIRHAVDKNSRVIAGYSLNCP